MGRSYLKRQKIRSRLYSLQKGLCAYCGKHCFLRQGERFDRLCFTIDHIVPLWRGGRDDMSNMIGACQGCNARKGGRSDALIERSARDMQATFSKNPELLARPISGNAYHHAWAKPAVSRTVLGVAKSIFWGLYRVHRRYMTWAEFISKLRKILEI